MQEQIRRKFNATFTVENYKLFLQDLDHKHHNAIEFRIAETPLFIPADFTKKVIDACEAIVDVIVDPSFKKLTEHAIPPGESVPGETEHTHFIAFDFGICQNIHGELEPQLIEMQGFPTLFAFQVYYPELLRNHFFVPNNYDNYLGGYNRDSYLQLLKEIILGDHQPENVILLEIKPHTQKTKIDFYCTQDYLDIPIVCLTELIQEGKQLFYEKDGVRIPVKRIYNRIIFDELNQQKASLGNVVDLTAELDVEWVSHPNWFYRISKYTLPFIKHPYVPETFFLDKVESIPEDLENYVLKPLFSFAGQGVIIDLTREDIDKIKDPSNWILQRKVNYAAIIKTPDVPAKAEIRIFYFWKDGMLRPVPTNNLARLSKGKMIGVRYNEDKTWVGGSVCFFETHKGEEA